MGWGVRMAIVFSGYTWSYRCNSMPNIPGVSGNTYGTYYFDMKNLTTPATPVLTVPVKCEFVHLDGYESMPKTYNVSASYRGVNYQKCFSNPISTGCILAPSFVIQEGVLITCPSQYAITITVKATYNVGVEFL